MGESGFEGCMTWKGCAMMGNDTVILKPHPGMDDTMMVLCRAKNGMERFYLYWQMAKDTGVFVAQNQEGWRYEYAFNRETAINFFKGMCYAPEPNMVFLASSGNNTIMRLDIPASVMCLRQFGVFVMDVLNMAERRKVCGDIQQG